MTKKIGGKTKKTAFEMEFQYSAIASDLAYRLTSLSHQTTSEDSLLRDAEEEDEMVANEEVEVVTTRREVRFTYG